MICLYKHYNCHYFVMSHHAKFWGYPYNKKYSSSHNYAFITMYTPVASAATFASKLILFSGSEVFPGVFEGWLPSASTSGHTCRSCMPRRNVLEWNEITKCKKVWWKQDFENAHHFEIKTSKFVSLQRKIF